MTIVFCPHPDSPLLRMERLGAVLLSAVSEVMSDNENLNPATYEKNSAGLLMACGEKGLESFV